MRIIGGTSRGRKLAAPRNLSLRPTSDRVKESIFNSLQDKIQETVVLDLFAGTGNLGIEALSRGAKKAVFVEKGRHAVRLIQKNLAQLGLEARSEIIPKDVSRAIGILKRRRECFDLILIDPPYQKGLIQDTLVRLASHSIEDSGSILVVEHNWREPLPSHLLGWNLIRQRRIGDTVLSFLTRSEEDRGRVIPYEEV